MAVSKNEKILLSYAVTAIVFYLDLAAGSQLSIVGEPKSVGLFPGANVELSCEAFGTPVPTIQWLHNGKIVNFESNPAQRSSLQQQKKYSSIDSVLSSPVMVERISNHGTRTFQMSTTKSKIRIPCANRDTTGLYTCVASNGRETVTANATVGLIEKGNALYSGNDCPKKRAEEKIDAAPAQIYMWTESRMERPSVSVQLMCRATGNPKPQIVWYQKSDNDVESSRLRPISPEDPRFMLLQNGDLLVRQTPADEPLSMFQCKAFNEYGGDSVESMLLEILDDTRSSDEVDNGNEIEQQPAILPQESITDDAIQTNEIEPADLEFPL